MRTNLLSFVLSSQNRQKIVRAIFEFPKRQWSCTFLEQEAKLPHATVYRTLSHLKEYGILKTEKINKRDVIYKLAESPITAELRRVMNFEKETTKEIARVFAKKINETAILFGSSVKGNMTKDSDIDILIITKRDQEKEREIQDIAAKISSDFNRTISVIFMDKKDIKENTEFVKSIKENMEVLHGKSPF